MEVDASRWSGEGTFTAVLLERLKTMPLLEFVRVEDAPASHADANYSFISNEVYVRLRGDRPRAAGRVLDFLRRRAPEPVAEAFEQFERQLAAMADVGAPDYSDGAMLQYLKTERIVPPYQTRGYKLVELVRIYRLTS